MSNEDMFTSSYRKDEDRTWFSVMWLQFALFHESREVFIFVQDGEKFSTTTSVSIGYARDLAGAINIAQYFLQDVNRELGFLRDRVLEDKED